MDTDAPAFEEIYAAFQPRIRRYLIHLVGEAEADDVAQEVFVKVHRALPDFRGEASLSTWLYRIATHAALDRLRAAPARETPEADLAEDGGQPGEVEWDDRDAWTGEKRPLPEQQVVRTEMNECLRGYVDRLPQDYRTVLVLSDVEGLRNQAIADILGLSLGAVKIRLHRARARLRAELLAHCDPSWAEENEYVPTFRG